MRKDTHKQLEGLKNNMNTLETIISQKIKDAEPATDILGADRKLLQVACQDFINYFKFNLNQADGNVNDTCLEHKIEKQLKEDKTELEAFLTVWTGMWLKKWKQRVKLLLGKQNQKDSSKSSANLADGQILLAKLECRQEMTDMLISTLVRNAEICGTEILAENILKMELAKSANQDDVNEKEQLLSVLSNSLRRAREMAQGLGPLIFVKVDKNYYAQ
jgi:hypothetical protein